MATPRRRLTSKSSALAPSGSPVEKPRSPAAREILALVQEIQSRIEQDRLEHQQMKELEYPKGAEGGQGELEMTDANSNLVQKRFSELVQQVVHIVQACNEEKELFEDELDWFQANLEILESRIQTDKHRVDSEVAGVGTQVQLQQAVLQEIRSGVNILQAQDDQIVEEANSIFEAYGIELDSMSMRITGCDAQILSIMGTNIGIQRSLKDMNSKIVTVNAVLNSLKNSLKDIPSSTELRQHVAAMEDQLVQSRELNTGLNPAMQGYKFSESASYGFGKQVPKAGPSTTVHPERQRYFGSDASSLRDTESEVSWFGRIRGGAGNGGAADGSAGGAADGAAGGAADGAAGGAADGAAGGAARGAGNPPPPGSGPPSNNGNDGNNGNSGNPRLSRRQQRI